MYKGLTKGVDDGSLNIMIGDWITYVPTLTGFNTTSALTNVFIYKIIGKTLIFDAMIAGTSSANTFTLSVPVSIKQPLDTSGNGLAINMPCSAANGGTQILTAIANLANPNINTITLNPFASGGTWTTTGAKQAYLNGVYEIY